MTVLDLLKDMFTKNNFFNTTNKVIEGTDKILNKEIEEQKTSPNLGDLNWATIENKPIEDTTGQNVETKVNGIGQSDLFKYIEEQQKKQWEREDLIRKETQEREDTAYQRTVADMVKAGINPNLMNVQPSASGGGITAATGIDYSLIDNEMRKQLTMLEQEIDQAFKQDENAKDRFIDIFGNVLQMIAMKLILGK